MTASGLFPNDYWPSAFAESMADKRNDGRGACPERSRGVIANRDPGDLSRRSRTSGVGLKGSDPGSSAYALVVLGLEFQPLGETANLKHKTSNPLPPISLPFSRPYNSL